MMMYSGSLFKVLIVVSVLQLFILIANAQAPQFLYYTCPNSTTYNQNSTYHTNLRRLLSDLSSNNAANSFFYNSIAGETSSDAAYGLFLCRGDVTFDDCRECVQTAITEVVQECPNAKEAIIWYDKCMLRYDNRSFFGVATNAPAIYMLNTQNATDQDRLNEILSDVMDRVANDASAEQSTYVGQVKNFAAGESNLTNFTKLYSLVQCTPDLSSFHCSRCLRSAIAQIITRLGGRVLIPSCNIRYETYQFYRIADSTPQPNSTTSPPPPPNEGFPVAVIVVIVVLITSTAILVTMLVYFLRKRARKKLTVKLEDTEADSLQYDLRLIRVATNDFSADNKIGEGGFGEVFKGSLNNGQQVAVKRLSKGSGQGDQEFKNEVTVVAKLQHRNLVRLLGYCLDKEEKILIFEFVPNKSLDFMLFDQQKQQSLEWSSRYKIIGGVARGILYLHEDSRLRIIHRDIKASNVLLDNDLNAKISDFGLARIVGLDKSEGSTNRIVGTFGYMSPEYIMHGQFSVKSDVFSFGVLVLEIISGKKNNKFYQSSEHLLSHAWKLWIDGTPLDLLDPTLGDSFDKYEVTRCVHIGLLCVQKDLDDRPTMASVVLMLNSSSMTLPIPHQPAFYVQGEIFPVSNSSGSVLSSSNGLSVSEMYPR